MVVHFVDIGEIDDHHCLNFLFIIRTCIKNPTTIRPRPQRPLLVEVFIIPVNSTLIA